MNDGHRSMAAHLMIALGLIAGVQLILVSPRQQELELAERQAVTLSAQQRDSNDPSNGEQHLESLEHEAERRLTEIRDYNTYVDPADLASMVQTIGEQAGVTVDRIDPQEIKPRDGLRDGDRRAQKLPTSGVAMVIEARGNYASVTRFVAGLESRPGFVRTDQVTLRPALSPGQDQLGVTIRTSQLAFEPADYTPQDPQEGAGS